MAPFLGWGPFGIIITHYLTKYANILYSLLETLIDLKDIVLKNEEAKKQYERASLKLYLLSEEKGVDSEEFLKARIEDGQKLLELIRYNHN